MKAFTMTLMTVFRTVICATALSIMCALHVSAQSEVTVVSADGYNVTVYNDFKQLEPLLNRSNDTVYVYNFWATWCVPCVKELPSFLKLDSLTKNQPVRVMLVSLDFKSKVQTQLIPFLKARNVKTGVVVLSDTDADAWINKISPDWNGSIPATLVVRKGKRYFYNREFTYDDLYSTVNNISKQP